MALGKPAIASRVRFAAAVIGLVAGFALPSTVPAFAEDAVVIPAAFTAEVNEQRALLSQSQQPELTPELLQWYVARQQQLQSFDHFDFESTELNESVLMSYIARTQNAALTAIDGSTEDGLTDTLLASYVADGFISTSVRVQRVAQEELCLTQAIYHEARGESPDGQLAVANVIVNRAMSGRYPSTVCGVIFQNADQGRYRCQFTFACDGRSDMGTERRAWNNATQLAQAVFREFQQGERPGIVPNDTLFYHTRQVAPSWSHTFNRVATIGAHVFYEPN